MSHTERLRGWLDAHPILAPVLVGATLRAIAVAFGYGYFAADDIVYAIDPAFQWLSEPEFVYPSAIRSPIFAQALSLVMQAGRAVSSELGPLGTVRWTYAVLGAFSLLSVPAIFLLTTPYFGARAGRNAAWLVAIFPLMPRISTLALLNVVCLPLLTFGLALVLHRRSPIALTLGSLCLALSALLRFQLGLVFLALVCAFLWQRERRSEFPWLVAGGALGALVEAAIDMHAGRAPFATILSYLEFNAQHSSQFGASSPLTYVTFFVLATLPPLGFVLYRPLLAAARRAPTLTWIFLVYLVVHSMVPHKEERFMFSALTVFFAFLGAALAGAYDRHPRLTVALWTLYGLGGILASTSAPHQSTADALLSIHDNEKKSDLVLAAGRFYLPKIYLDGKVPVAPRSSIPWHRRDEIVGTESFHLVFLGPPRSDRDLIELRRHRCKLEGVFPCDIWDRLVLWVNFEPNKRRQARHLYRCDAAP